HSCPAESHRQECPCHGGDGRNNHERNEPNMRKTILFSLLLAIICGLHQPATGQLNPSAAVPPVAKNVPRELAIHGDKLVDNYFWLREKSNPEVIAYLEAENAYTQAVMKPTEAFQETLYSEMLGRIKQTDVNVPYRLGDYWYYSRTETGKQ